MVVLRRLIAVLVGLRALTNLGKPFGAGGFVVFGFLMHGMASTVVAPLFGVAMLVYAYGLWVASSWARPLAIAYAAWATVNVVLFPIVEGVPARFEPWMYLLFALPGVVGPWLAVWLLGRADLLKLVEDHRFVAKPAPTEPRSRSPRAS